MSDLTPSQAKAVNDAAQAVWAEMKSVLDESQAEVKRLGGETVETANKIEKMQDALDARLDALETHRNRPVLDSEKDALAVEALGVFMRKGAQGLAAEPELAKALATDVDSEGGYLIPENVADVILEKLVEASPLRQLANIETISKGNSFQMPVEDGVFATGWTQERATRAETTAGTFELLEIPTHELYAKPLATQFMLDDAAYDVEGWIQRKLGEQFGKKEATAFVVGTGVGQPQGIMAGGITSQDTAASGTLTADDVLDLIFALPEAYAANAALLWNRLTTRTLRKERATVTGEYLWAPGVDAQTAPTFAGYKYHEATDIATIASGAKSVVFGDIAKTYTIVDRKGMTTLRDPFSSKPFVEFYTTKRVGGQVTLAEASRVLTVKA